MQKIIHDENPQADEGDVMQQNKSDAKKPFRGLRFKFAVIIGILVTVLMVADAIVSVYVQTQQAEREALEKAEVLADEMRAAWDFIDMNQDVINRNEDGSFRTKTLVCAVAAKSISTLFTSGTDYIIRFTSESPRQKANAPDDFEQEALDAFNADRSLESYWDIRTDEETGESVFRYVEPLEVTETCLECHGDPKGELDQYGYEKEGMREGDIGGAMSITEPMDIYDSAISASVAQQVFMMLLMLAIACVGIYILVNRVILHPIDKLSAAAENIEQGSFDNIRNVVPVGITGPDELTEFARDFERMAQQLERLYSNLENEVEKQTDELKVLNDLLLYQKKELKLALDKISEEAAYKNEFFAIVSHELRTPLTSILAFARILQESKELDDRARSSIMEIESNATLLLNLVNNILTISKAEAHKNELLPEPVDYVDLISFIRKSLEPLAANKDITFTTKADPDVPVSMADWEKLRRIVENLTDNAIKYTHRGGKVSVHVHFEETRSLNGSPGTIVIDVADDGMGIAEEDLVDIFDLYKQAGQSANRRYRGTGLGLAVVKELTELHGGRVSVVSQYKHGSTFTVELPYVPVDEEEEDDEDSAC